MCLRRLHLAIAIAGGAALCEASGCQNASNARPAPAAETVTAPPGSSVSASASPPPGPPSAIDETFRRYKEKIPAPTTLSEGNGASTDCASGAHATYNVLEAAGRKVPISGDADLPRLVPWVRDADLCIRQIAIEALLPHLPIDSNALGLPSMHDPEHVQFHDILGTLKGYLDQHQIHYERAIFDGLMLDVAASDFAAVIHGKWEEEIGPSHNFQYFVDVDAGSMSVLHKLRRPDPNSPDTTHLIQIKDVAVNATRRFVVTGEWRIETNTRGFRGQKQTPQAPYLFLPVKEDVAWFDNGEAGHFIKLRRTARQ